MEVIDLTGEMQCVKASSTQKKRKRTTLQETLDHDKQNNNSTNNNNNNKDNDSSTQTQGTEDTTHNTQREQQHKRKQKKQQQYQQKGEKEEEEQVNDVQDIPLEDGGLLKYCKQFMTQKEADDMFEELLALTNWKQGSISMYGKVVKTPRMQSWMADPKLSGVSLYQKQPQLPWSPSVWELKTRIEKLVGCRFDYVLLNMYRDGNDYIGWHADREAIPKGKNVVASVSLGATRRFLLKHTKRENEVPKREFSLTSGSLIVMLEETQRHWKHTVPKESGVKNARINLTFRIN